MTVDMGILEEFVAEAQDHFETIEDDFLRLAANMDDPDRELVDKVFRAIHSVKGGAGFLQLTTIAELSHAMENILSSIRAGEMSLSQIIIDTLLAGVDLVNAMLESPETSNETDIGPVRDRLVEIMEQGSTDQSRLDSKTDVDLEDETGESTGFTISLAALKRLPPNHEFLYVLSYDLDQVWRDRKQSPITLIKNLTSTGEIVDARLTASTDDLSAGLPEGPLVYEVLYSTLLGPETIEYAVCLSGECAMPLNKEDLLARADALAEKVRSGEDAGGDEEDIVIDLDGPLPGDSAPAKEEIEIPEIDLGDEPEATGGDAGEPAMDAGVDVDADAGGGSDAATDMVGQFTSEGEEQLEQLEQVLCAIFDEPDSAPGSVQEAFRLTHSFKGNAGMVNLPSLEKVAHAMESVLDYFRECVTPRREADRSVLFAALDGLKTGLSSVSSGGDGKVPGADRLVRDLQSLSEPSEADGEASCNPVEAPAKSKAPAQPPAQAAQASAIKKTERRDLRVDLEKLDDLMNLVGELVIGEVMVTRNPDIEGLASERFERASHNLRRIIADLQDVVMSVRMVPLSRTFRRMIRLVHDLSNKAGKRVHLELVGEETEVDKTVIEQISDPLVHLIRNSVDHGVETPDERKAAGKAEEAEVTISAGHEGGEVVIRVKDDGRGLSREKILAKGVKQGLIQGDGRNMSDEEVYRLIFEPGFSTAEQITDVSGRGVGMDVVRRNLEKIKGRVDVSSTPGQGSTMSLRIPLTLAIIDGMLIRVGTARYTIPLLSIRESFRPLPQQVSKTMDGQELVKVRDDLIPVVRLGEFYDIPADINELDQGILICVGAGGRQLCLFADEILGHHQTVIKAMPGTTGQARGISGCTILGDGEVSLIMDVESLMDAAEHQSGQR